MKKIIRYILTICVFLSILFIANTVNAADYSIEKIDMQVVLQKDGSLKINQTLEYNFEGSYNGIYITIPVGVDDKKYEDIRNKTSIVDDDFYNSSSVEINQISVLGRNFKQQKYATNGQDGIYTVEELNGIKKIKVYSPTSNSSKIFRIDYTLRNVAVRHKDIGEIYYNFIGGAWERTIKKLNIDIKLPNNTNLDNLYAFAHGPYNGKVTIKDLNNINLYVENVKSGQYVAGRILFDLNNIAESKKESNKLALILIMQEEENIYYKVEEKNRFNNNLLKLSGILLIYWLILILKYEKDKKYDVASKEDEMFRRYNPLLAGCIQENRNVLSRDIIAIILELVNKKYLTLEIISKIHNEDSIIKKKLKYDEDYIYKLTKNKKSEYQPDEIEEYIVEWLFEKDEVVELLSRLKELPKEKDANTKFKKLDEIAMRKLNKLGANKAKVPIVIRILNVFIFIITIILSIYNYMNSINDENIVILEITGYIIFIALAYLPLFMYFLIIPIKLLSVVRKSVNKVVQKVNGQKVVFTSISIIFMFLCVMILTAIFIKDKCLLVNELLICVGTVIMLTDNLMLKNDPIIAEDYSRLNALKYKIENYSMMDEKQIKEIVLWEKYLTYAISFGIADKIVDRIKPMINDEDLTKILDSNSFLDYVVSDYSYFNIHINSIAIQKIENAAGKIASFGGGFTGGRGGGFSGGGRSSGGGGRGRRRWSILNGICKDMEK